MSKIQFRSSPFRIIASLYLFFTFAFMCLYLLPGSLNQSLSVVDAWFLSASAMSVTGLSTINLAEHLSSFGKIILLIQIQMGGIGIMAILGVLFMTFGQNVSLSQQTLMSLDQNQRGLKSVKKLIFFIIGFTLTIEAIGFAIFFPTIHHEYSDLPTAIYISLFHATASFTGSGFDMFGGSLADYATHSTFMVTSGVLIFLGAIGFPTILDLLFSKGKKKSLYTKVNLFTHGGLLLIGFSLFFLFEFFHSFDGFNLRDKLANAAFLSVTSRNAGLSTIDLGELSSSGLFLLLLLMFIGGSASSCAGGIRTTTFAVLIAKLMSIVRGQTDVVLFKKSLHEEDVNKSFLVVSVFLGLFLFSTMLLSFSEPFTLDEIMFEVMSALTTTGLSIGITEELSSFSKIWLSLLMIVGRIGIISIIYTLIKPKKSSTKYVKEHLIVG